MNRVRPREDDYLLIRPVTSLGDRRYQSCNVTLLIAKDFSHVLIGGGPWGYDGSAREVDDIELAALAQRFDVPELKKVLELAKANPRPTRPLSIPALDYHSRQSETDPSSGASGIAAGVFALLSLACVAVPAAGWVTRNGPLFLCGGVIAPVIGMLLATVGIARGRSPDAGTCAFALLINGVIATYFAWLFFVRGLC
ncbi:MAG TPA: hypothetical protein VH475_15790 [Tepidisphaeraceae bacterium]